MNTETFLSPRNLNKENKIGWSLIILGFLSVFLLVFLLQWIGKTGNRLIANLLVIGMTVGFSGGLYYLKDANSHFNVILSANSLCIEKKFYNSAISSQQFDWTSISNLILGENATIGIPRYKLKFSFISKFGEKTEEKEFSLRKYSRNREQQLYLYKRINFSWVSSRKEHEDFVTPTNRQSYNCQLCFESYPYSDSHYICNRCSRKLCDSCYVTCKSVEKTTCPNCNGDLIMNPI